MFMPHFLQMMAPRSIQSDDEEPGRELCWRTIYGIGRPAMNQGYNATFSFQIEEEVEPTLVAAGASGVAHPRFSSSKASFFTEANEECANTLVATDYKDPPIVNDGENTDYIVRRLTPTECARLQGFPDWWCDGLAIAEPTDEDIVKWREIFHIHAKQWERPQSQRRTTRSESGYRIQGLILLNIKCGETEWHYRMFILFCPALCTMHKNLPHKGSIFVPPVNAHNRCFYRGLE